MFFSPDIFNRCIIVLPFCRLPKPRACQSLHWWIPPASRHQWRPRASKQPRPQLQMYRSLVTRHRRLMVLGASSRCWQGVVGSMWQHLLVHSRVQVYTYLTKSR
jgi:hypothetical protein